MTKNASSNQVFISYAREDDEPFVKRLYEDLINHDIRVWWDRKAMESRGRTFLQELRDAIEEVDRIIFVVGPKAVKSEYCRAELEHSLLFAKGVVPVLRLGEHSILPSELAKFHCPDFRETRSYDEALKELLAKLAEPVAPLGPLRSLVPALPPHFIPRTDEIARLSQTVLADVHRPTVVNSAKQVIGLHGLGGSGKSVLAAAFARATETRRAFPDGIVWLSVGQKADILQLLQQMGLAFKDDPVRYITVEAAQAAMTDLLMDRVCLVILDNVWEIHAITPFRDALGSRCRLLLTTRDGGIVTRLAAQDLSLDVLTDKQALILLADWSGQSIETLPDEAKKVARECGNLPLALAMIGASVRGKPNRWGNVLHRLQSSDLHRIRQEFPNYPYPDLFRAFDISMKALDQNDPVQSLARVHYSDFAVFPEYVAVPEATVERYWKQSGLDEFDTQDVIDLLVDRSLIQRDKQDCLRLHDLQVDYVRNKAGDLKALHSRLVDAYAENCSEGWQSGPDDGYFFQQLLYHLNKAGRVNELGRLLMDFDWLQAKLEATDATALLRDYDLVSAQPEIESTHRAIKLSVHVLTADKAQLASQLIGRLLDCKELKITALLDRAAKYRGAAWYRPLTSSLTGPGDPLIMTLTGHKDGVSALAVVDGKRQLLSCGGDIKVGDLDSGQLLKTVTKPGSGYSVMAATAEGRLAVLGSDDNQVEVWETGSDSDPRFLGSHSDYVAAVDITPDGKYAISGSGDGSICVWDVTTGKNISTIKASEEHITAIAITPDAKTAVSASGDSSLKVWDINSGELSFDLKGHKWLWVESIVITGDGRQLLSASTELKLWNLETGE